MFQRVLRGILLQSLTLFLLIAACEATSLGLSVHVVPLDSDGGNSVRAHFTVIAPSPCPDFSSVCATGEDCVAHLTSFPLTYSLPNPAWCVRQWQKTVPSNYNSELSLGTSTKFLVHINAGPKIRANNGKLNQPPFVALPPPLRARVNCPHPFHLSVKDLDGDKVKCRFASASKGECIDCDPQPFMDLDQDKCILTFNGNAKPGQYFIYVMVEDLIPVPKTNQVFDNTPLSSVPIHLSLNVTESASNCSNEPVPTDGTPEDNSIVTVLPFQEVKINLNYKSDVESVSELAMVGPPDLYRVGFVSVSSLSTVTVGWIRSANNLTRLLPICFVANTNSLQSSPRCMWLYQREMLGLPAGTELKCEKTQMTLVLPVASLSNINLAELQLNSPTCPVTYNSTHLTAQISLTGCGTKAVHTGSELVYTNTLKSVRPYTMISRLPQLILPLACRIPGAQVKGPQYAVKMPSEKETFGPIQVWLEFHFPGEGPFSKFTTVPKFRSNFIPPARVSRDVVAETVTITTTNSTSTADYSNGLVGSKIKQLDLHVMSNCSVQRAEMVVTQCIESETEDFAQSTAILDQGCMTSNNTLEVVTTNTTSKVYRLALNTMMASGTTMFIQCKVQLCITTMPSDKCPDVCSKATSLKSLVGSVFTSTYTVRSGPVSLVITPAPPTAEAVTSTTNNSTQPITSTTTTTAAPTTTTTSALPTSKATVTSASHTGTTSRAPQMTRSVLMEITLTTVAVFLHKVILL